MTISRINKPCRIFIMSVLLLSVFEAASESSDTDVTHQEVILTSYSFSELHRFVDISDDIVTVYETGGNERRLIRETVLEPFMFSGPHRILEPAAAEPEFLVLKGWKDFYLLELSSGLVSSRLIPRFPGGVLADAQSGNIQNIRLIPTRNRLTGKALDLGQFLYDVTDPLNPVQIDFTFPPGGSEETGRSSINSFAYVEELIELGISLGSRHNRNTILNTVIEAKRIVAASLLLNAGVGTSVFGGRGTPLQYALTSGREDMVHLLLDYGADPEKPGLLNGLYDNEMQIVLKKILERRLRPPALIQFNQLDGMTADDLNEIGLNHHREGDYKVSLEIFSYASLKDPDSARGYFNQACALSLLGQYSQAVAKLAKSSALPVRRFRVGISLIF